MGCPCKARKHDEPATSVNQPEPAQTPAPQPSGDAVTASGGAQR